MKEFLLLSVLFLSCNSLKVTNVVRENVSDRNIQEVFYIGKNDEISHAGKFICDIVLKQNNIHLVDGDIEWNRIKDEINREARIKGGNVLEIEKIGYDVNGYGFYLSGSLYFVDNFVEKKHDENCSIVLLRDGLEGGIASLFKIKVSIDDEDFGSLKKDMPIAKELAGCFETVSLKCNRDEFDIRMSGETKYFKISTREDYDESLLIETSSTIEIGSVHLDEIQFPDLARLILMQHDK